MKKKSGKVKKNLEKSKKFKKFKNKILTTIL